MIYYQLPIHTKPFSTSISTFRSKRLKNLSAWSMPMPIQESYGFEGQIAKKMCASSFSSEGRQRVQHVQLSRFSFHSP